MWIAYLGILLQKNNKSNMGSSKYLYGYYSWLFYALVRPQLNRTIDSKRQFIHLPLIILSWILLILWEAEVGNKDILVSWYHALPLSQSKIQ